MKSLIVFLVLILALAYTVAGEPKKCRALVIEGGGPRNAYSAGVLKAITNLLEKQEHSYDIVSGMSMGAINTFILAMHAPGDELAAVNEMLQFWKDLNSDKVYENWGFGYAEGLLSQSGLYNLDPFTKTIKNLMSKYNGPFLRNFTITLTDLNSGKRAVADHESDMANFAAYLKASLVSPGFFPPVLKDNMTLCDGSVISSADIPEVIERCRQVTEKDEDIILDLIMVQEVKSLTKDCKDYSALKMLLRYLEIWGYVSSVHALEEMMNNYPLITQRYLFYPEDQLPSNTISVTFDKKQIDKMITQGEVEAINSIKSLKMGMPRWKDVIDTMNGRLYNER